MLLGPHHGNLQRGFLEAKSHSQVAPPKKGLVDNANIGLYRTKTGRLGTNVGGHLWGQMVESIFVFETPK